MASEHLTPLRAAQASIADASWHLSNHPEQYLDRHVLVSATDLQSLLSLIETLLVDGGMHSLSPPPTS